jgi:hypothetical protein
MSEEAIHVSILAYLRAVLEPPAKVLHPANGGARSKATAGRLKAMGVLAGVPDLMVLLPPARLLLIEVKGPRGRVSPEQQAFARDALAMGFPFAVVRSIDETRAALRLWQVPTREAA